MISHSSHVSLLLSSFLFFPHSNSDDDELDVGPLDKKMERITLSASNIHRHLRDITRTQSYMWARESRHRHTAENNLFRVNVR